jgi:protein-S-isoprenylcysteine O-methyltransferase Ste14
MSPWFGYALFVAGNVAGIIIRVPHDKRSKQVRVVEDRKGAVEKTLLALLTIALLLPLVTMTTPMLAFANYPFQPTCMALGAVSMGLYLWRFHRAHADLGDNWSFTLQVREGHRLVTSGIYRRIRHPMYAAIYMVAVAQILLVANWISGPAMLVAFTAMVVLRVGPEEQLMIDRFGDEYRAYAATTKRLIPGVW